ncbi:MAG: Mur ligase domain-containing protein, partial [Bacteroidota bacterium]
MNIRLGEIAKIVGGELKGSPEHVIDTIFIDSRKYFVSSGSLFVALSGERNNGHDFIPVLMKTGVKAFMAERIPEGITAGKSSFVIVKNSLD